MPDAIKNAAREIVNAIMQSPYSSGLPEDIHWRTAKSERIASILRRHLAPVVKDRPDEDGLWVAARPDGMQLAVRVYEGHVDEVWGSVGRPTITLWIESGYTRWVKIAVPELGPVDQNKNS